MENSSPLLLEQQNNCFVIDWLTFTAHGDTVDYCKWLLGLDSPDIPWEESEKFRNGYPCSCYWNGITISYGADDPRYYKDSSKARSDMGICVNLSGKGCRAFESHGHGDWLKLFQFLFRDTSCIARDQLKFKSYNVTRIDLAFDDHTGILDIHQLERDTRDRSYVSRAKYCDITWSDNQDTDIQGLTIQIGSPKSDVLIRIYDKAAERGFKDRHWIRVEIQLRSERALSAGKELLNQNHIGRVASGILRNYLTYRVKTEDSNPSRWPMAAYWDKLLLDMDSIRLWLSPGEEYNLSKTEYWLVKQYGACIVALDQVYSGSDHLIARCKDLFPLSDLAPKYKSIIASKKDDDSIVMPTSDLPVVDKVDLPKIIGNNLAFYRQQFGLTQDRLASDLGLSVSAVISIESCKYTPGIDLAYKIANYFHISISDLFIWGC